MTARPAEFEEGGGPSFLHHASDLIEAAERAGASGTRAQALSQWFLVLSLVDQNIDTSWDVHDVPVKGAPPPPVHGIVFPSGEVDPSSIPDPAERAEYVRALQASKDALREFDVQFQLRRMEERALRFVELLLTQSYGSEEQDRQELESLLAQSALSEGRKEQLRVMMAKSPPAAS